MPKNNIAFFNFGGKLFQHCGFIKTTGFPKKQQFNEPFIKPIWWIVKTHIDVLPWIRPDQKFTNSRCRISSQKITNEKSYTQWNYYGMDYKIWGPVGASTIELLMMYLLKINYQKGTKKNSLMWVLMLNIIEDFFGTPTFTMNIRVWQEKFSILPIDGSQKKYSGISLLNLV